MNKINWNNVAGWARTLGTVASAVQLAYPQNNRVALICTVAVAVTGELVKQITAPGTWPQTPVVNPVEQPK
jgi:hypothetical protein